MGSGPQATPTSSSASPPPPPPPPPASPSPRIATPQGLELSHSSRPTGPVNHQLPHSPQHGPSLDAARPFTHTLFTALCTPGLAPPHTPGWMADKVSVIPIGGIPRWSYRHDSHRVKACRDIRNSLAVPCLFYIILQCFGPLHDCLMSLIHLRSPPNIERVSSLIYPSFHE